MRAVTALLLLACSLASAAIVREKGPFETIYSWSQVNYVFTDEAHREAMVKDKTYIPGHSLPFGFDVDPYSGRIFVSLPRVKYGIPATLATVSSTKGANGEYLLEPYLGWDYHKFGNCEGFSSVFKTYIDECGRLWVLDSGLAATHDYEGLYRREQFEFICPPKIAIFDLKTDTLIKSYHFPEYMVYNTSTFANLVVDVGSTEGECKHTYAYVADGGSYGLIVYDFDKDDAWRVVSNEMYPYPEYGYFDINGVKYDHMYGILGLSLTPKREGHDRYLYFHSLASAAESYVKTSYLQNKEYFTHEYAYGHDFEHREFHTYQHRRPFGQSGSEVFYDEGGVMFFPSRHNMSIYCWNYETDYKKENFYEVAKDTDNFDVIMRVNVVKTGGVPELYVLSSKYYKYLFGMPDLNEIHFRILKAPIDKLVAGTHCIGGEGKLVGGVVGLEPAIGGGTGVVRETVIGGVKRGGAVIGGV